MQKSPNTCGRYIKPINGFKKDIKGLLETHSIHSVTFDDIDRGELSLHLFGNNSITIVPILKDEEAKLKIEMTYSQKKEDIL